ncbi:MAG: hypothetical protein HKN26_00430, partial [Acidimicrobiales bacterium]|nr:hypothetical protein [Acidimicrobiales bacterium]
VMPLPVGGAFHTPLMAPARDRLRKAIDQLEFRSTEGTVVANVDATVHDSPADWCDLLHAQLTSPVRWRQSLHTLADAGFTTFVELGPGTVLTGTVKRTLKGSKHLSVSAPDDIDAVLAELAGPPTSSAGQLEGEHLFATERLVVSPAAGVFTPLDGLSEDAGVTTGQLLGHVGEHEVRSAFTGHLVGVLAMEGERVSARAPIAWLRIIE